MGSEMCIRDRPCFLSSPPQGPADRRGLSLSSTQLLTTWVTWADFSPLSGAPVTPVSRQTSPRSVPSTGGRSACLEPVGSVRRDPKLNSRRPGRTLGQTRPARQGLVRVPESNTKYGGKGGITGGNPAPVMGPSIGESTRIPKTKKLFGACGNRLRPAVHRAGIFSAAGVALERLT